MNTRRIFVSCQMSRGSFSGEVVFEIQTVKGGKYVGVAPRRDCRKYSGEAIAVTDLPENGEFVDGKLVTRLIANGGDVARIALPDGEDVYVPVNSVSERESEIAHVPV